VVIRNFSLFRIAITPLKTNTPLVINANAPLTLPFTPQSLKPVRWWKAKISQLKSCINRIEFHECPLLYAGGKFSRKLAMENLFSLAAPE
jgi:hypothetical protein